MTQKEQEEQRAQVIMGIMELLHHTPFTFEFKVKKRPSGIKVIYELTQDEMEIILSANHKKKED